MDTISWNQWIPITDYNPNLIEKSRNIFFKKTVQDKKHDQIITYDKEMLYLNAVLIYVYKGFVILEKN